ncbi:MAG TPA: SGNH/GDSL hydrolase family protein [Mycobacterium sp.]
MNRYVALGSSMAAGPGIRPRAPGAPLRSGRSARNYPHLVAAELNLELVDRTFSGATTAHALTERQRSAPPQIDTLDGSESLVTITIGGNDVGYVPMLMAAALPRPLASLIRRGLPGDQDRALAQVGESLRNVGNAVRERAPHARVLFVDYLTLLPPAGVSAAPLPDVEADLCRHVAAGLEEQTAAAAAATGCGIVRAGQASRDHHPWSAQPWAVGPGWPLPWRPAPFHPNAAGMRAVADLVAAQYRP